MNANEIKKQLQQLHSNPYDWTIFFEVTTGQRGGRLDALAFKHSWATPNIKGYEIKTSRADFLSDKKWPGYLDYCHMFYFVCPKGMISRKEIEDMDENVGLIYYDEDYNNCGFYTMKAPTYRNIDIPADLLYRIIMSHLESEKYPFHSDKAEYFKAWLENKKNNSVLGHTVEYELGQTIMKQQREIDKLKRQFENNKEEFEKAEKIMKYLNDNVPDIFEGWSSGLKDDWRESLDEVLKSSLQDKDKRIIRNAISAAKRLEKITS